MLERITIHPGERLLDVGAGNGAAVINAARRFGLDGVGVDVDPEQVACANAALAAQETCGVEFVCADAQQLPFAEQSFQIVISSKTTHHVPDWARALDEMARVLAPGGHLCYTDFVAPFGQRLPTRCGIRAFAERNGLIVVHRNAGVFQHSLIFCKVEAQG